MRTLSNPTNPLVAWARHRWWIPALLAASMVLGSMAVAKGPQLSGFMSDEPFRGGVLSQDPL